jgi:hypothetical protein
MILLHLLVLEVSRELLIPVRSRSEDSGGPELGGEVGVGLLESLVDSEDVVTDSTGLTVGSGSSTSCFWLWLPTYFDD